MISHTPAMSQLPLCGNAKMRPLPFAISASKRATSSSAMCTDAAAFANPMAGSRNASYQYLAYERIASATSSSGTSCGRSAPITRARLRRNCCGPPLRRPTIAPAPSKAVLPHRSGSRRTPAHPAR
ncbi:Uncharacterised protein [Mycobacteroides abscessus subsp. abscessus]|nr:Uncharacterised protein [Mycobacteroides abscessus subsp. abscessus]